MIRYLHRAVIACLLLVLAGCETTSTTAVWKDPGYVSPSMKSVFVIGVSENRANRRLFEDTMVKALVAKGVAAQSSYRQIPDAKDIGKESVEAAIAGKAVDGVLVTRLLGVDKESVYVPPPQRSSLNHYSHYYHYYAWSYDAVSTPGYYHTYKTARVETNVYAVKSGELAWSMQSSTLDPDRVKEAIDSVVNAVTGQMRSDGLI
jgi:hypothetical protein